MPLDPLTLWYAAMALWLLTSLAHLAVAICHYRQAVVTSRRSQSDE